MRGLLADAVVAGHTLYVAFVVGGFVAIGIGWARRWAWVRNPWFRLSHAAAILFVAAQDLLGRDCPLTVLEQDLRRSAGESVPEGTFVGRLLDWLIFDTVPGWALNLLYRVLGAAALLLLFAVPPASAPLARRPPHRPPHRPLHRPLHRPHLDARRPVLPALDPPGRKHGERRPHGCTDCAASMESRFVPPAWVHDLRSWPGTTDCAARMESRFAPPAWRHGLRLRNGSTDRARSSSGFVWRSGAALPRGSASRAGTRAQSFRSLDPPFNRAPRRAKMAQPGRPPFAEPPLATHPWRALTGDRAGARGLR